MTRAIPALPVQEIAPAAAFYRERLGFTIRHQDGDYAIAERDGVEIHLWAACDASWKARSADAWGVPVKSGAETFIAGTSGCRIEVRGIDDLFAEYKQRGVLYGPDTVIEKEPWGTREFPALDHERNLLTFFERV